MPLTQGDRRFIRTVDRLKVYALGLSGAVLLFLMFTPASQIHLATMVIGFALCWMVWLTQRLISLLTIVDLELTKAIDVLKRTLPAESRQELQRH